MSERNDMLYSKRDGTGWHEIISEIGPDERPFANHIFVVRIEVDALGPDGLSKLDLAATDRVDIDDNRIEER